ncbi:MAG: GntR family transcriptional regulator [candidate division KSB1 bacterium]|nr:GntR family transcriptional regulator [candidate division KSB1 bacterium]
MKSIIYIDHDSKMPKYEQLVNSIRNSIRQGRLRQGDVLPSINAIVEHYPIARDTVCKSFQMLKSLGIVSSVPGKGYFVSQTQFANRHHIFLLFDNFHSYKESLFNSFKTQMGENAIIDLYFHHSNDKLFKSLIKEALNHYTEYVIMPMRDSQHFEWMQRLISNQRVYILDVGYTLFGKAYPSVCQNFEKQWYEALKSSKERLYKYETLVLVEWREPVYNLDTMNDAEMIQGFKRFCEEEMIPYRIIDKRNEFQVQDGCCYIIPNNEDLVTAVQQANQKNLKIGRDIGIIAHNDEPLKQIAANTGIATISTDFVEMGRRMADMILKHEDLHIENPSSMILRDSI